MIHVDFKKFSTSPITVRCPTREEAENLFSFLRNETDARWSNGDELTYTNHHVYGESTHYDFGSNAHGMQYGSGCWGKEHGSMFMSVDEFIETHRGNHAEDDIPDFSDIL